MKSKFSFLIFTFLILTGANFICAQPQKLTKEQLTEKSNALYESGRQREAIDLINQYPEFSDETEILYVKSVAYTELRDYKNADIAFQKQFDAFLKNAAESKSMTVEISSGEMSADLKKNTLSIMYAAALISYASADLTNALRAAAFEKNGMPEARREPKNLAGFDEFRKTYEQTALDAGNFYLQTNQLKEALSNFSKAIELNPKNPASYTGRAKVYRKQKKIKLAAADEANARRYAVKK